MVIPLLLVQIRSGKDGWDRVPVFSSKGSLLLFSRAGAALVPASWEDFRVGVIRKRQRDGMMDRLLTSDQSSVLPFLLAPCPEAQRWARIPYFLSRRENVIRFL